jgi:hypothetical protein
MTKRSSSGSKQVDHWTSGTVYKCSEIAGSAHPFDIIEGVSAIFLKTKIFRFLI